MLGNQGLCRNDPYSLQVGSVLLRPITHKKLKKGQKSSYLMVAETAISKREQQQLDAEQQRAEFEQVIAKLKSHRAATVKAADDSSSKARSGLFDPPQAQLEIVNLEKERNALREELQKLKTLVEQVRKETKERLKQKEKETATYPRLLPFSLLLGGGGEAV